MCEAEQRLIIVTKDGSITYAKGSSVFKPQCVKDNCVENRGQISQAVKFRGGRAKGLREFYEFGV